MARKRGPLPPVESAEKRDEAAKLIAIGRMTKDAIAKKLDIGRQTIYDWLQDPEFVVLVGKASKAYYSSAAAVAERSAYNTQTERARRLQAARELQASRAELYTRRLMECEDAQRGDGTGIERCIQKGEYFPGAETGLLVATRKMIGSGEFAVEVVEWEVDTGLLESLRKLEESFDKCIGDAHQRAVEYEIKHKMAQVKMGEAQLEALKKQTEGSGPPPAWKTEVYVTPTRSPEDAANLAEVLAEIDGEK